MSFAPIGDNPELELQGGRASERELEMKAEQRAQLDQDDDDGASHAGGLRQGLRRAWSAIRHRG